MKILSAEQIRRVDALTIGCEPIASVDLMERAASACYRWITERFGKEVHIKIFIGPGNNGGDGLALARMMTVTGFHVWAIFLTQPSSLSADAQINYHRLNNLKGVTYIFWEDAGPLPELHKSDLVIDALFGTGLSRPLTGRAIELVKHINQSGATVLSIDIPSGLQADENLYPYPEAIVHANYTLTFQLPKRSFLFAENELYVGEWYLLDIGLSAQAIDQQVSDCYYNEAHDIAKLLHHRKKFAHKGHFGHALLMAGSHGKIGAAALASKACLRAGAGLLTTQVPFKGHEIIQATVPEAMTITDDNPDFLSLMVDLSNYDAVGIGPGIGTAGKTGTLVFQLLSTVKRPMVLDADALNLIAQHPEWRGLLCENFIITPHPGEFDRMAGPSKCGFERYNKQVAFSKKYNTIVVLKGAYTSISAPDGSCWYNPTGNPGMATAGSGDVLTGIILSLLAQGYEPLKAAIIAVYIHGLAGDLACAAMGEEALLASDIINYLGHAFQKIKKL